MYRSVVGVFHAVLSMTAFVTFSFFSQDEPDFLNEQHYKIQSIVMSIIRNDFSKAGSEWKEITEMQTDYASHLDVSLDQLLYKEILSLAFNESTESFTFEFRNQSEIEYDRLCSPVSIKIAKFIHLCMNSSRKHIYYATLYAKMKSNDQLYNSSAIYVIGQLILADNAQSHPLPNFRNVNLLDMIPTAVWACLLPRNIILRNVKYRSYLYVGNNATSGKREVLAWNREQLTNKKQAIFRIQPFNGGTATSKCDQVKFVWHHTPLNITIGYSISEIKTQSFMSNNSTLDEENEYLWNLQLVDNTSIRIMSHEFGRLDLQKTGVLYAQGSEVDSIRSRVDIDISQDSINKHSSDSFWHVTFA